MRKYFYNLVAALPFFKDKYRQIIVCGIPRSGTSLVFSLVNQSTTSMTPKFPKNKKPTKNSGFTREMSGLCLLKKPGNFITKLPDDLFSIEEACKLNKLRKSILFLVVIRDLRDVLTSKHQWGNGDYYLSFKYKNTITGKVDYNRGLKDYLSILYNLTDLKIDEKVKVEIIKYEDLVSNPAYLISILKKHGYVDEAEKTWKSVKKTRIYDEVSVPKRLKQETSRWKNEKHRDRIMSEFEENPELFEAMIRMAYESDDSWFQHFKNA